VSVAALSILANDVLDLREEQENEELLKTDTEMPYQRCLQKCGRKGLVVQASRRDQGGVYAVFQFAHPSPDQGEETCS
jgi:hypothetical protein